jgi:putative heme-binding domain-containing protein
LRYFRALDFQTNPNKTQILFDLLNNPHNSSEMTTLIFKHLDVVAAQKIPTFNKLLPQFVANIQSPIDYIDIVKKYQLKDQSKRLTDLALAFADSSLGVEAAKLQVKIHGKEVFQKMAMDKDTSFAKKAIGLFGQVDEEPVTNELIQLFSNKKLPKNIREQAAWAMYGWESEETLWKLIKNKKFPDDLMPIAQTILMGTWHSDIRTEATKMFGNKTASDIGNVADLIKLKGDAQKGSKVFENYCQACHQIGTKGINFGPALTEIGSKLSKEGLYNAIINPSQGISFGYENYVLKLKDGSEQQGFLLSKTENEVNLKQMGGSQASFKRSEIKSMTEQKESVMPSFPLQKQEIVDLVEYLQSLKKK